MDIQCRSRYIDLLELLLNKKYLLSTEILLLFEHKLAQSNMDWLHYKQSGNYINNVEDQWAIGNMRFAEVARLQ